MSYIIEKVCRLFMGKHDAVKLYDGENYLGMMLHVKSMSNTGNVAVNTKEFQFSVREGTKCDGVLFEDFNGEQILVSVAKAKELFKNGMSRHSEKDGGDFVTIPFDQIKLVNDGIDPGFPF